MQKDDLCWSLVYAGERLEIPDTYSFIIPRNNYLYWTFNSLFTAIKKNSLFNNDLYVNKLTIKKINDDNSHHKLFRDGKIEWHSDDLPYNEASVLTISDEEDGFKVEFKKSTDHEFPTYCVYFGIEGDSRYNPFQVAFENMYVELVKYQYINGKAILNLLGETELYPSYNKTRTKKNNKEYGE